MNRFTVNFGSNYGMFLDAHGEWVRFTDHEAAIAALEAENDALKIQIERWQNVTARKDPDDCAEGIRQLHTNWLSAKDERDALLRQRDDLDVDNKRMAALMRKMHAARAADIAAAIDAALAVKGE